MVKIFYAIFSVLLSTLALAGSNVGLTYQGVLTDPNEVPYTTTQTVIFQIYEPSSNNCLLWTESQNITPDSKGRFSAVIGAGSNTAGGNLTFKQVFTNAGTLTPLTCTTGTTYTPTSSDDRLLTVTVAGFGGQQFLTNQLPKIACLRQEIQKQALDVLIEVDGGINQDTIKLCEQVDVIVAGSFVFKTKPYGPQINLLKR